MPSPGRSDARWGYVSNVFVHQDHRNLGIGSALMASLITAADDRGYVRLVLWPSAPALRFFQRAGFVSADDAAGADRLLVRRASARRDEPRHACPAGDGCPAEYREFGQLPRPSGSNGADLHAKR
jgi:GNAT superfamily N-acetyltransferase